MLFRVFGAVLLLATGACARYDYTGSLNVQPATGIMTRPGQILADLPPPPKPINVSVYDFQDLTGQNKSSFNANFAEFSRAITQGSSAIVVDALKNAGRGTWFNVGERSYIDSLLRERRLIQETFAVTKRNPRTLIDPLSFAEYLVTGGVVSYDAPIANASVAGGYAGYTGGLSGHKDLVTVNVRLVRVRDGVVVKSINASRPIITLGASASVARILRNSVIDVQASAGLAEATQTAVREAIETAVYEMVRQNVNSGFWTLAQAPLAVAAGPVDLPRVSASAVPPARSDVAVGTPDPVTTSSTKRPATTPDVAPETPKPGSRRLAGADAPEPSQVAAALPQPVAEVRREPYPREPENAR